MKPRFKIIPVANGRWEYRNGDIIGIDRREWVSLGPDSYLVKNIKTGVTYKREHTSKYAARKFITNKRKSL